MFLSKFTYKKVFNETVKVIVLPKMKMTPWFTHPQAILGVYDFRLSEENNQS